MYAILECGDMEVTPESKWDFVGFVPSIKAAEKAIREDVLANFEPDCLFDNFEDYCNAYRICKLVSDVQPVPVVKTSVRLNVECAQ